MKYAPVTPIARVSTGGDGHVRRVWMTEATVDRATLIRDGGTGKAVVEFMVDGMLGWLTARGLRQGSRVDVAVSDQRSDLLMRNEVEFIATVEAEGLLPEERLPQGWRAFFCAP